MFNYLNIYQYANIFKYLYLNYFMDIISYNNHKI